MILKLWVGLYRLCPVPSHNTKRTSTSLSLSLSPSSPACLLYLLSKGPSLHWLLSHLVSVLLSVCCLLLPPLPLGQFPKGKKKEKKRRKEEYMREEEMESHHCEESSFFIIFWGYLSLSPPPKFLPF